MHAADPIIKRKLIKKNDLFDTPCADLYPEREIVIIEDKREIDVINE